jgi:hypothetical protein
MSSVKTAKESGRRFVVWPHALKRRLIGSVFYRLRRLGHTKPRKNEQQSEQSDETNIIRDSGVDHCMRLRRTTEPIKEPGSYNIQRTHKFPKSHLRECSTARFQHGPACFGCRQQNGVGTKPRSLSYRCSQYIVANLVKPLRQ